MSGVPAASPSPTSPPPTPSGSPATPAPTGAARPALVLKVVSDGGIAGPDRTGRLLPTYALYADGQLITQGPVPAVFPGPALPNLLVTRLTPRGVQRVIDGARAAGLLGGNKHYDAQGIADAQTVTITIFDGQTRHVTSAYALMEDFGGGETRPDASPVRGEGGGDGGTAVGRAGMRRFLLELGEVETRLAEDVISRAEPYRPEALAVFVTETKTGVPVDQPKPQRVQWPVEPALGDLGTQVGGTTFKCGVIRGDDGAKVFAAATNAGSNAIWESDDRTYLLSFRPLLPDETECPQPAPPGA